MSSDWLAKARTLQDPLLRALYVAGVVEREVNTEGARAVVVGGTAVAWHTRGLYLSGDVDLLCPRAPLERAMQRLGFEREGRHWLRADLGLLLEAPGDALESYRDRTVEVEVEGVKVTLLSVEESILDRLRACVHWRSELDCEQALQMLLIHREAIDWPYLERRALRDQVADALAEVRKRAGSDD